MIYNFTRKQAAPYKPPTPKKEGNKKYFTPNTIGVIDNNFFDVVSWDKFYNNNLIGVMGWNGENPLFIDLKENPHLLVSGLTKSGKSVFVNTLLLSLLLKNTTDKLELFIIDPKLVDWINYKDIPQCKKYATSETQAISTLKAAYNEMNRRNEKLQTEKKKNIYVSENEYSDIFILFDEVASYSKNKEITWYLEEIARMGRNAGIHLFLITQNPTVKIINSQIKNNMSARVCFRVSSSSASRVILDCNGGEKLRGNGHGLVRFSDGDLFRFQSVMVSDKQESFLLDIWERQKNGGFLVGDDNYNYFIELNNIYKNKTV